jgi:hypothetical protein
MDAGNRRVSLKASEAERHVDSGLPNCPVNSSLDQIARCGQHDSCLAARRPFFLKIGPPAWLN